MRVVVDTKVLVTGNGKRKTRNTKHETLSRRKPSGSTGRLAQIFLDHYAESSDE